MPNNIETLRKITLEDIKNHKLISEEELQKDLANLKSLSVIENTNSLVGNPFLYHHQLPNLLKCKREKGTTLYELYNDEEKWNKLLESTIIRNRCGKTFENDVFEAFRINTGSVVMFKASTAKYIYSKYKATSVLDPTAGWGGRMLGAWALDIDYTGIDTNFNMSGAYADMIKELNDYKEVSLFGEKSKIKMLWENCLSVDFSKIEYDCVLTSPPYINMEIYENMEIWDSKELFYNEFLIPLIGKCKKYIKDNGKVCFNISPKMYEESLYYGLEPAEQEEDLLQQLRPNENRKQDKIYIWDKE